MFRMPTQGSTADGSFNKTILAFAALFPAAILIAVVVSHGDFFNAFDWFSLHAYNKTYLREAVFEGRLPWWNPHVYLGRPFLADVETAVFYPPNWLFLVLPSGIALFAVLWLHLSAGIYAMGRLCREWGADSAPALIAGATWGLSAQVVGRIQVGHLGYVCGLCLLPAGVLLTERLCDKPSRRHWLALVLFLVATFLCGQPHQFWAGALVLTIYVAVRSVTGHGLRNLLLRPARGVAALWSAYGVALALVAFQLLPFLFLATEGNRESSPEFAGSFAMRWADLGGVFLSAPSWLPLNFENNLFVGAIVGIAGLLGLSRLQDPRLRGLLASALIGLLIGLGQKTPLFEPLLHVVPGMSSLRIPGRSAAAVPLVLIVGASLWATRPHAWASKPLLFSALGLLLLLGLAFNLSPTSTAWFFGGLGAALGTWWLRSIAPKPGARNIALALGTVFAALELGSHVTRSAANWRPPAPVDPQLAAIIDPVVAAHRQPYPVRIMVDPWLAPQNHGMAQGYSSPDGYVAMASARVWFYLHQVAGVPPSREMNTFLPRTIYSNRPEILDPADVQLVIRIGEPQIDMRRNPLARAWTTDAALSVSNWREALARLKQGHDLFRFPLIESSEVHLPNPSANGPSLARAGWVSFSAERIELTVERADHERILVVGETWYPGWEALVEGVPREVFPANVWMRATRILPGETSIVMTYTQPGFAEGLGISALTALTLGLFWFRSRAPIIAN